eukprot:TRINITY_DN3764_c0_g1_i4.p1 TRINITY_DN3764_c0_g1~~TRINITY_DN3764_c0_g1_i4.p1  ORF type:complete len:225 (+),score=33.19 TRINITY_DN3764_c0_g1_i4:81-755(+)
MIRRPPRSTLSSSSAASDVYKRQGINAEYGDPYLDYVFDGEEITYSIRMWTHGWDIFSPNENILYHYYGRKKAKRFWEIVPPNWNARKGLGETRIKYLLQSVPKDHSQPSERYIPIAGQIATTTTTDTPLLGAISSSSSQQQQQGVGVVSALLPSTAAIDVVDSGGSMELSLEDFYKASPRQWARDIDAYGLGAERPLQAYYPYAGLNPVTRQFKDGWFCARKS